MGCVDELCAGLADLARPVHVGTVLVRVRPRPLKTQFYRRPAVQWSRRAYAGALKRRYDDLKNEKMENRNTFSGRNTSFVWVPTISEPHRDLLRSLDVVWRPREGFGPIWGVLSDDEDTSGQCGNQNFQTIGLASVGESNVDKGISILMLNETENKKTGDGFYDFRPPLLSSPV